MRTSVKRDASEFLNQRFSSAAAAFAAGLLSASPPDLASLLSASELDEIAGRNGRFSGLPPREIVSQALQRELSSVRCLTLNIQGR